MKITARILYGLAIGLLALSVNPAYATTYPASGVWTYSSSPDDFDSAWSACEWIMQNTYAGGRELHYVRHNFSTNYTCRATEIGSSTMLNSQTIRSEMQCPNGGTLENYADGDTYQYQCVDAPPCPEGEERDETGQCVENPCEVGETYSSGYYPIGNSPDGSISTTACAGGCTVIFQGNTPAARRLVDGEYQYFASGEYVTTDFSCTESDDLAPSQQVETLPEETCPEGTLRRVDMVTDQVSCLDPDTGDEIDPHQTTDPDTSTETTDTTVEHHADGSTTETTITQHADGSTTVTETTTDSDGNTSTTSTHTDAQGEGDPMDAFCDENPQSPMCVDGEASGGCEDFSCTGDPIQCEIASAVWQQRCLSEWAENENEFSHEFQSAYDAMQSGETFEPEPVLDEGTLEFETYVTGAQSCPSDLTISIGGVEQTVPVSWLCGYLDVISIIMQALAWLFVVGMISRGI